MAMAMTIVDVDVDDDKVMCSRPPGKVRKVSVPSLKL
jgi:hypothetical protein